MCVFSYTISHLFQEKKIVGGSQQLSEGMVKMLECEVKLNCPVVRVIQNNQGVTVVDKHGTVYKVRVLIHIKNLTSVVIESYISRH